MYRYRFLLIPLLLVSVAILALAAFWLLKPANPIIAGKDFEGVVFTKENAADLLGVAVSNDRSGEAYWTPAKADIINVESQLALYAERQAPALAVQLPSFKRQYFGFIRDGKRLILIVGFCPLSGNRWQREIVSLADMPYGCYFEAQYDFTSGTFLYLWQNSDR